MLHQAKKIIAILMSLFTFATLISIPQVSAQWTVQFQPPLHRGYSDVGGPGFFDAEFNVYTGFMHARAIVYAIGDCYAWARFEVDFTYTGSTAINDFELSCHINTTILAFVGSAESRIYERLIDVTTGEIFPDILLWEYSTSFGRCNLDEDRVFTWTQFLEQGHQYTVEIYVYSHADVYAFPWPDPWAFGVAELYFGWNLLTIISRELVAAFTFSPLDPTTGETVYFDATSSVGSNIVLYEWDYDGNGITDYTSTKPDPKGPQPYWVYQKAGRYWAWLTITRANGQQDSCGIPVDVQTLPPVAKFTYQPSAPKVGDTVSFNALDSKAPSYDPDGSIVQYEWDFNYDGRVDATGPQASYVFNTFWKKTVRLIVTDDYGAKGYCDKVIPVGPPNLLYNPGFEIASPPLNYWTYNNVEWLLGDQGGTYAKEGYCKVKLPKESVLIGGNPWLGQTVNSTNVYSLTYRLYVRAAFCINALQGASRPSGFGMELYDPSSGDRIEVCAIVKSDGTKMWHVEIDFGTGLGEIFDIPFSAIPASAQWTFGNWIYVGIDVLTRKPRKATNYYSDVKIFAKPTIPFGVPNDLVFSKTYVSASLEEAALFEGYDVALDLVGRSLAGVNDNAFVDDVYMGNPYASDVLWYG